MQASSVGIALIKQFEGFRPQVYLCPAGYPTIGYGHRVKTGENFAGPITEEQAETLLREDLHPIEYQLNNMLNLNAWRLIKSPQYDALCSLIYNVGMAAFKTSRMFKKISACDFLGAANEFDNWNHINGQVSAGLTKRRMAEKALFLQGL